MHILCYTHTMLYTYYAIYIICYIYTMLYTFYGIYILCYTHIMIYIYIYIYIYILGYFLCDFASPSSGWGHTFGPEKNNRQESVKLFKPSIS